MRELVDLAVLLQQMAGSAEKAMSWVEAIGARGEHCVANLGVRGDPALVLTAAARGAGLIRTDGTGDRVRAAETVILLDLLDSVSTPQPPPTPDHELVFTVPRSVEHLVQPRQRLDLLVDDVIARAKSTLSIGGPFWNTDGWERLKPVILPALLKRQVQITFYLHPSESGHRGVINEMRLFAFKGVAVV